MSLFGDLPALGAAGDGSTSAPSSLLARRTLAPPPSILRNKQKRKAGDVDQPVAAAPGFPLPEARGLFAAFGSIEDEYDPAVPNEYQKAKEDQQAAILNAEMEARKAAQEREAVRPQPCCPVSLPCCAPRGSRAALCTAPAARRRGRRKTRRRRKRRGRRWARALQTRAARRAPRVRPRNMLRPAGVSPTCSTWCCACKI